MLYVTGAINTVLTPAHKEEMRRYLYNHQVIASPGAVILFPVLMVSQHGCFPQVASSQTLVSWQAMENLGKPSVLWQLGNMRKFFSLPSYCGGFVCCTHSSCIVAIIH